jgi:hypothetical protein
MNIDTLIKYSQMMKAGTFPSMEEQKYKSVSEFSHAWNDFVFYESGRSADQLGYGFHPLSFLNDLLYT